MEVTSPIESTDDGRWVVVDGRRWRATDPSIPPRLRQELVDALMDHRRAVGAARRASDRTGEAAARVRVHRTKVALGERGEPWWAATDAGRAERVEATILALVEHRGPGRTICPSDAARVVGGDGWRQLLPLAREVARRLAADGAVRVLQRGEPLDPSSGWRGPIRIGAVPNGQGTARER